MNIDPNRLRRLRQERHWSQEQLAELSGLNLRTIQRLEAGAGISTESLRALAAVFEVEPESLLVTKPSPSQSVLQAIRGEALRGLEFRGYSRRRQFWWFALAVVLLLAFARLIAERWGIVFFQIAGLLLLVPWVAACSRRLRDAGLSVWWQLMALVPVAGLLLLLFLLTRPSSSSAGGETIAE
jgi:transcriptional regulator with XRE-family HTH domain